ncbi:MAG: hypothetical protein IPJ40_20320 [Saprospirales bacterium]|nr:hypothetical protein [Saprospirales bacterium]
MQNRGAQARRFLDFKDLIDEVLNSIKYILKSWAHRLIFKPKATFFPIEADQAHLLTSVVYNLIDNALKYSPGRPVIHIHLSAFMAWIIS